MNPHLNPLGPELADSFASELGRIERRVLLACSDRGEPPSCGSLAARTGFSEREIAVALVHFTGKGLVEVAPARWINRYDGSGYLLNQRGVAVRHAIIRRYKWAQKAAGVQG